MNNQIEKYVVVVAGGKGLRMGGDIPKQFLPVKGKPILMRTLERFKSFDEEIHIVLVLPQSHFKYWKELCEQYEFQVEHRLVAGGETRYHSVKNGLFSIENPSANALVAIHDGVRPFVSVETIQRTFEMAANHVAAVPVIDSVDSLRLCEGTNSHSVDRSKYKLVQTPQTFQLQALREAYLLEYRDTFTDDASVFESAGHEIQLVRGNRENVKITTTFDMKIAEVLVDK